MEVPTSFRYQKRLSSLEPNSWEIFLEVLAKFSFVTESKFQFDNLGNFQSVFDSFSPVFFVGAVAGFPKTS